MVNQKKVWSSPQIITMNNSSVQDGNPTNPYVGEFSAYCTGTCVAATAVYSTYASSGINSTAIFCTTGATVAVCS